MVLVATTVKESYVGICKVLVELECVEHGSVAIFQLPPSEASWWTRRAKATELISSCKPIFGTLETELGKKDVYVTRPIFSVESISGIGLGQF